MDAFLSVPNHGGSLRNLWTAYAFRRATRQFVAKATIIWSIGIPTSTSPSTCPGKAAAMQRHRRRLVVRINAQNRTALGGQNGAKILSERVPIANAACAPR